MVDGGMTLQNSHYKYLPNIFCDASADQDSDLTKTLPMTLWPAGCGAWCRPALMGDNGYRLEHNYSVSKSVHHKDAFISQLK